MKQITTTAAFRHLIAAAQKGNLTFLAGAGISKIPPSNLPLGNDIKDYLISLITANSALTSHRDNILYSPKYKKLIPELIFQPLYETLEAKMYAAFDILDSDAYNHVHEVLAWLEVHKNARLYTTNFDLLIEKSSRATVDVEHLHGALNEPDEMTIRIYQVGRGIQRKMATQFQSTNKGRTLFVIGYSGNDKDVVTLLNQTAFQQIYWLMRDATDDWTLSNIKKLTHHDTNIFQGDLKTFFRNAISHYSIPATTVGKKGTATPLVVKDIGITQVEALRCIQSIYYTIGEYKKALAVCDIIFRNKKAKFTAQDRAWFHQVAADNITCIGIHFRSAVSHINKSIALSKKHRNTLDLAEAYNAIGNTYGQRSKSNAADALNALRLAKRAADSLLKKKLPLLQQDQLYVLLGKIHNNTGLAYDSLGDYHKAIEHYKRSIAYKKKAGNITAIAVTQANISLCYRSLGDRRYLYWEKKAEEIFSQYGLFYRLGYLFRELGARSKESQRTEAITYLEQALQVYEGNVPDATFDITLTKRNLIGLKKK